MQRKPRVSTLRPKVQMGALFALTALILTTGTSSHAKHLSSRLSIDHWKLDFALDASQDEYAPQRRIRFGEPASPNRAFRYSLFSTLMPMASGGLIFAFHGPETITTRINNGTTISYKGPEPNRTLPAMLILGGATLGPAAGYFYGNRTGRGFAGIGLRTGVTMVGTLAALAICPACTDNSSEGKLANAVLAGTAGLILASSIYDIASVRRLVSKENEKRERSALSVRPLMSTGFRPSGLTLTLRF